MKKDQSVNDKPLNREVSRRDFIKTSAFVGGTGILATQLPRAMQKASPHLGGLTGENAETNAVYPLGQPENVVYSICLQCHTACSIKTHVVDGIVIKVDGNPYSPMNLLPHLDQATPVAEAARVDAKLCPKGQAGIQTTYDPYRLRKILKRKGPRGSGQWETVDFNQAIDEIVNGGDLFGEGPVPGLKDIYKLRDAKLSKEMAGDAANVGKGKMTVDEFKAKYADNLDVLIDPDRPDLGPVNNQFVLQCGRIEHGRKELGKRFAGPSFGSKNFYEHTSICEQSHHIAYKQMTGGKTHFKPDILNAEFVIFFGTGAFEANFGPTPMAEKVTESLVNRNFKMAVVDPRLSKTAAKAQWWVPIKPGTDAAMALGMIRWIIENERYDKAYLENPNKDAAAADNESTSTDATHLINLDTMLFLTPEDAGLERPVDKNGNPVSGLYVVMTADGPALHSEAEAGLLEGAFTVNGVKAKPVFQLLKERAQEKTLSEAAAICGIPEKSIVELASEFTSHGKKAAIDLYRGPVQHTNGYYNAQTIITLNVLIGNMDWTGGLQAGGGHWHEDGSKAGAPFPKSNVAGGTPGGFKAFGHKLTREGSSYEASTYFQTDGYPAKRPWYPFTGNVYQEVIPSAGDGYPYPIKALLIHKGTPAMASPAGHSAIDILRDTEKIPLLMASDIIIGETTMYADYVIPDLSFLERWATSHTTPDVMTKISKVRQPTAAPLTEIVTVDGEEMPISLEAFMIAVGKKMGLPGFGKDGLGEGFNFDRPEQFYLALAANLAFGDKEDGSETLPAADEAEMQIFRAARSHLPSAVFDEAQWKAAVTPAVWPSVVYLLNRGGRFEAANKAYDGDKVHHKWGKVWHLYPEPVAKAKNSLSGERFSGLPLFEPVRDAAGKEIKDDGFDMTLITFKEISGGHSRTISNYWSNLAILPENFVLLNRADAASQGLRDGDEVFITSATLREGKFDLGNGQEYAVKGKVRAIEGIAPGTVAVSWHYGHWAYGSNDVVVDGKTVTGDRRRGTGILPNPAMRLDPSVNAVCLTDPIGGSASFYDTRVKLKKA